MDDIVGMLRIRNEARWIAEVLNALQPICSRLFVMDDRSEDDTAAISAHCGATVWPSPFTTMDEARDKDWLLARITAETAPGTWILCVDGDEILEADGPEKIRQSIASTNGAAEAFALPILYLWDRRDQIRVDGVYGRFARPSLFRTNGSRLSYMRTGGSNLHCASVPTRFIGRCRPCPAALLHLGYLYREDRVRKYEYYRRIDPGNRAEDGYRHMVQGDVPEIPASARLMHAGPLELRAL